MALDIRPGTRRAFLGATAAGLAGWVASAFVRPGAVSANTDGQSMTLGKENTCSTDGTFVSNIDFADAELVGGKTAVYGASVASSGLGIDGYVTGASGKAVRARTTGSSSQIALDADTTDGNGEGISVRARTRNGVGVLARATGGYALQVEGRAVFDRSGRKSFPAGASTRTITGLSIGSDTLALATIQGDVSGTWVRGVSTSTSAGSITIRLNKAAPKSLVVGWFLVN